MILVYSFFSFFLGQNGIYMRKNLQSEQARLAENNEVLKTTHKNYLATRDSLLNDADAISVYARQLGYSNGNEEFIRIMGLGIASKTELPAGQVFYAVTPQYVSDSTIKVVSLVLGLLLLMVFIINDFYLIREKVLELAYSARARFLSR